MLAPMKDRWQQLDLEGGGLQTANQHYVRRMKRRALAYLLWLAFPLGLHRIYLNDRRGALGYGALTALTLTAWLAGLPTVALALAGLETAWALFDLWWMDRRRVQLNKDLRLTISLGTGATPPPGFQGRETDLEAELERYRRLKEQERPAEREVGREPKLGGQHIPSFREQERLLREMAKKRARNKGQKRVE